MKDVMAFILSSPECWNKEHDCFDNIKLVAKSNRRKHGFTDTEIMINASMAKVYVYDWRRLFLNKKD